jgi:DNA-binding CsgD family transcriptional regulator
MATDQILLELIRLLYGAAAGHEQWSAFLNRYAQAVRSPAAALLVQDVVNQHGNITASVGIDPYWQQLYDEHYSATNIWTVRGAHLFQPGNVVTPEQAHISDREVMATAFYTDYLRPQDFFYSFGGIITRDQSVTSYITSLRSKSAGTYNEAELTLLRTLMPHLQCAMRVHGRVAALEDRLLAANDALDRLPWGVMVVHSDSKVTWMNRCAEAIVLRRDGLLVCSGRLQAASNEESKRLRTTVAAAVQTSDGGLSPGTVLAISRPSGLRPLSLLIAPLPPRSPSTFGGPAAVVFLSDPEEKPEPSGDVLQRLFGLTRTEARLAVALLQGKTVEEYADEFSVSLNTARTHLKRIFMKTGAARQSELMRLLLGSAAGLRQ